MTIDKDFPSPYILKKLEYDTFKYLRNHHVVNSDPAFDKFKRDVDNFFFRISSTDYLYNDNLNFESHIVYKNADKELLFVLGFIIDGTERKARRNQIASKKYKRISYSLTICKKDAGIIKPIRRFHFDYAIKEVEQPGPIFHFQFPGKLSPYLIKINVDCSDYDNRFESWLEQPRFNYFPISFAILLDVFFTEFPSPATDKIKNDSLWLGIINKNEEKLLKPYFKVCDSFLNKSSASNLFTRSFCHGINT